MKISKILMFVAATATTLAGCQKDTDTPTAERTMHFSLRAAEEQTKTAIDESDVNSILWAAEGEQMTLVCYNGSTMKDAASSDYLVDDTDYKTAMFDFTMPVPTETADSYIYGGIYPTSAVVSGNTDATAYKVSLPETQSATGASYDPAAYIMVSRPITSATLLTDATELWFRKAVALNKITLKGFTFKGTNEIVKSVTVTAAGKTLAGRRKFDITIGESGEIYYGQKDNVTINYATAPSLAENAFDVWFTSWNTVIAEGEKLTIVVTTDQYTYEREITANANGIKFTEGKLNKLSINMATATSEQLSVIADGDYLIIGRGSDTAVWNMMSAYNSGLYYDRAESNINLTFDELSSDDFTTVTANEIWAVAKIDGGYSIQNKASNKYLNYTGSGNAAHESDTAVAFTVSAVAGSNGAYDVTSVASSTRTLRYNSSSPRFAFYTSGQQQTYFLPFVGGYISVTPTSMSWAASETTAQTVTVAASSAFTVELSDAVNWTASAISGNTFTIAPKVANTSETESKTCTATILLTGIGKTATVNCEQAKFDGTQIAKYTITTTTAVSTSGTAPTGSSATYEQTYTSKCQMPKNNSTTLTLTGYAGHTIKGITLNMKSSNKGAGAGSLNITAGSTKIASIENAAFNSGNWYVSTSVGTSTVDVVIPTANITEYAILTDESITINIAATVNSLYIYSYTIEYK